MIKSFCYPLNVNKKQSAVYYPTSCHTCCFGQALLLVKDVTLVTKTWNKFVHLRTVGIQSTDCLGSFSGAL